MADRVALLEMIGKPRRRSAVRPSTTRMIDTLRGMGVWGALEEKKVMPPKATRSKRVWPTVIIIGGGEAEARAPDLFAPTRSSCTITRPLPPPDLALYPRAITRSLPPPALVLPASAPTQPDLPLLLPASTWSCACAGGDTCRSLKHRGRDHCGAEPTPTDKKHKVRVCGSCRRNACVARKKHTAPPRNKKQPTLSFRKATPSAHPQTSAPVPLPPPPRPLLATSGDPAGRFYFSAALNLAVGPANNYEQFCRFVKAPVRQFCVASDRKDVPGSSVRVDDSCDARVEDLLKIYIELRAVVVSNVGATYVCCNMGEVRSVSLFIRLLAAETGEMPTSILHSMRSEYSPRVLPDRLAVSLVFGPFAGVMQATGRRVRV